MRISDNQFSQMMLQSLQSNSAGLGKVLQQMSTRERLTKLSDDPMASIKLLNLERENSAIAQYQSNIANLKTTLSSQETHLDSVNESLKSMRDIVLWGANGSLTDQDRSGMITRRKATVTPSNRLSMRKMKKATFCFRAQKPIPRLSINQVALMWSKATAMFVW